MKKFLAIAVAMGVCGLYFTGCQKEAGETKGEAPAKVEQKFVPPPPPPPPPPPAPAPAAPAQPQQ